MPPKVPQTAPVIIRRPVVDKSQNVENILNVRGKPVTPESTGATFLELQKAFGLVGPSMVASWKEDQDKQILAKYATDDYKTLKTALAKQESKWDKKGLYPTGGGAYQRFRELELLGEKYADEMGRELAANEPKFHTRNSADPQKWAQDLFNSKAPSSPIARRRAGELWGDTLNNWLRRVDREKARQDRIRIDADQLDQFELILSDYVNGTIPDRTGDREAGERWGRTNLPTVFRMIQENGKTPRRIKVEEMYTNEEGKGVKWTLKQASVEDDQISAIYRTHIRLVELAKTYENLRGDSSPIDLARKGFGRYFVSAAKAIEDLAATDQVGAGEQLGRLEESKLLLSGLLKAPWNEEALGAPLYLAQEAAITAAFHAAGAAISKGTTETLATQTHRVNEVIYKELYDWRAENENKQISYTEAFRLLNGVLPAKDLPFVMGQQLLLKATETFNKVPLRYTARELKGIRTITEDPSTTRLEKIPLIIKFLRQEALFQETEEASPAVVTEPRQYRGPIDYVLRDAPISSAADPPAEAPPTTTDTAQEEIIRRKTSQAATLIRATSDFNTVYDSIMGQLNLRSTVNPDRWGHNFKYRQPQVTAVFEDNLRFKHLPYAIATGAYKALNDKLREIVRSHTEEGVYQPARGNKAIEEQVATFNTDLRGMFSTDERGEIVFNDELMDRWLDAPTIDNINEYRGKMTLARRGGVEKPIGKDTYDPYQPKGYSGESPMHPFDTWDMTGFVTTPIAAASPVWGENSKALLKGLFPLRYSYERSRDVWWAPSRPEAVIERGTILYDTGAEFVRLWSARSLGAGSDGKEEWAQLSTNIIELGVVWEAKKQPTLELIPTDVAETRPGKYLIQPGGLTEIGNMPLLRQRMQDGVQGVNPNAHGVVPTPDEIKQIKRLEQQSIFATEAYLRIYREAGHLDKEIFKTGFTSGGFHLAAKAVSIEPFHFIYGDPKKMMDGLIELTTDKQVSLQGRGHYEAIKSLDGGKYKANTDMVDNTGEISGNNELVVAYERYTRMAILHSNKAPMPFKSFVYRQMTGLVTRSGVAMTEVAQYHSDLVGRLPPTQPSN